jgi:cell division protein FtsL
MQINTEKYQEWAIKQAARLRDPRMIGIGLFLVIVFLITWSGVKAIEANYGLQRQIAKLEQQNAVQQLTNENMQLQKEYYNTPQYLEIAARKEFGMAASGETVLVVPKDVALKHTVDTPAAQAQNTQQAAAKKPAFQHNFDAWMDFFLNRDHTTEP